VKISIITATFNSEQFLSDCIKSVNNQTFNDIEHIFIDGASADKTLELIKSLSNRDKIVVSEPDNGIYDAMNKGISKATGEIISILNSDDLYIDDFVIERVMDVFRSTDCDCVYADLLYVDKSDTNKIVRYWKTREYVPGSFKNGWHPAHPSLFLKRKVYSQYGDFDLSYKLAADFEFMLRIIEKYRISSIYLPLPLVKMRLGGATNKNFKNIYYQNIECIRAFTKNGLKAGLFYPFFRLIPKLKQYFA
jgi:glycosyltransferase involved in cell wall biosynthesis